jgi:hypothetical protein
VKQCNETIALFVWLISHQPAVLFSQNKSATNNQPAVLFSQNKSAPAISHQPNEQAVYINSDDGDSVTGSNTEPFVLSIPYHPWLAMPQARSADPRIWPPRRETCIG